MKSILIVLTVIACPTVAAIAVFVWPTPFEYRDSTAKSVIQINRFNGEVRVVYDPYGVHSAGD